MITFPIKEFEIHCYLPNVAGFTYYFSFSGVVPNVTGTDYLLIPESDKRQIVKSKGEDQSGTDPEGSLGSFFSPTHKIIWRDDIISDYRSYAPPTPADFPVSFSNLLILATKNPFARSTKNGNGHYTNGVFCTIDKADKDNNRSTVFRGFIDQETFDFDSQTGTRKTKNFAGVKFSFDVHDRHKMFLESTPYRELANAIKAAATASFMPDADIRGLDCGAVSAQVALRNSITETFDGMNYTITQTKDSDGSQPGTFERFLSTQSIFNTIASYAGLENTTAVVDLSKLVLAYDGRYCFTDQFTKTNPYDTGLSDSAQGLHNVSKLFALNDLDVDGVDWETNVDKIGETPLAKDCDNASAVLVKFSTDNNLVAKFVEISAGVLQLQLSRRLTSRDTPTQIVTLAAPLKGYKENPYAAPIKSFNVASRDQAAFPYPDSTTGRKESIGVETMTREFELDENREVHQRNYLYAVGTQILTRINAPIEPRARTRYLRCSGQNIFNTQDTAFIVGYEFDYKDSQEQNIRPVVLRSQSGGINGTWRRLGFDGTDPLLDVYCLSNKICHAVGLNSGIYKTGDAGCKWVKKTPLQRTGDKTTGLDSSRCFQIYFITNLCGYIATEYEILKTEDGGETWRVVTVDNNGITSFGFANHPYITAMYPIKTGTNTVDIFIATLEQPAFQFGSGVYGAQVYSIRKASDTLTGYSLLNFMGNYLQESIRNPQSYNYGNYNSGTNSTTIEMDLTATGFSVNDKVWVSDETQQNYTTILSITHDSFTNRTLLEVQGDFHTSQFTHGGTSYTITRTGAVYSQKLVTHGQRIRRLSSASDDITKIMAVGGGDTDDPLGDGNTHGIVLRSTTSGTAWTDLSGSIDYQTSEPLSNYTYVDVNYVSAGGDFIAIVGYKGRTGIGNHPTPKIFTPHSNQANYPTWNEFFPTSTFSEFGSLGNNADLQFFAWTGKQTFFNFTSAGDFSNVFELTGNSPWVIDIMNARISSVSPCPLIVGIKTKYAMDNSLLGQYWSKANVLTTFSKTIITAPQNMALTRAIELREQFRLGSRHASASFLGSVLTIDQEIGIGDITFDFDGNFWRATAYTSSIKGDKAGLYNSKFDLVDITE